MTFEQISKDIRDRKFKPVYLFSGEEPYFIDKLTNQLIDTVLTEDEKEFNQTIFYGLDSDVLNVESEARKFPMMSEYNLVVVKEAQLLSNIEHLENYMKNPAPSTILVLSYKKKADKRKNFFKSFSSKGVHFVSDKLYDNKVPDWIISHVSHAGYHISVRNATLITDFLGNDLSHISNELGKVILNLPEGTNISGDIIEEYIGINKEYNSFEFNNAIGHKNIVKTFRIVQYFGQNEKKFPIQMVIANLYNFFTKLLKLHYARGLSGKELGGFLGVHPFFVKDYQMAARHYNRSKIVSIIGILQEYDLRSKGIGDAGTSDGELLKELAYKILH